MDVLWPGVYTDRVQRPDGVALDNQGRAYVTYGGPPGAPPPPPGAPPGARTRTFPNRVVEFGPMGAARKTVQLPGIQLAWGVAVDGRGDVYVTGIEALVKASPVGRLLGRWNRIVPPKRKYALPDQPVVDHQGNVYATDGSGNILKISLTGRLLGAIVRAGTGPNALQQPTGLTLNNGHLFVGERGLNRIKEFSLTGQLLAIWTP